jgi:pimeloyl-ACP methyl ester carboxylesterase
MFEWFGEWRARRKERRLEKLSAATIEPVFVGERIGSDEAVVFVHGLAGHFRDTWKQFPDLLIGDPDLPRLDILLAGYDASPHPWTRSIEDEAKRFASNLRTIFPQDEEVFLVGHSMGGLIILQGLVHELQSNRANERPANAVRHVTLYASPTMGSELAAVIKLTFGQVPILNKVISRQIEELSTGGYCSVLIREVVNRIYSPTIAAGDANSKRQIEVTACVGMKDRVVKTESAESIFNKQPPVYLDHDHFTIKEPISRTDLRYLPMKNMLVKHFVDWLPDFRAQSANQRSQALADAILLQRIRHALISRLKARTDLRWETMSPADQEDWILLYFSLVIDPSATSPGMRFDTLLNNALQGL